MKRIFAIFVFFVIIFGTFNVIGAGLLNKDVEASTFTFAPVNEYSYDAHVRGSGVRIATDKSLSDTILVRETNKENYTKLMESQSPATKIYSSHRNGTQLDYPFETVKTVNESNLYIIVEKNNANPSISITTGLFEKDGSYYHAQIKHNYNPDSVDKDIQIIKDIYSSLKKK